MYTPVIKRIVSIEYLAAAIIVVLFYINVGRFPWYWLFVLYVVFDISMVGYLVSPKMGAVMYNIGHSLVGPTVLLAIYSLTSNQGMLFVSLLWLFHIFFDRALGYGLKHATSFHDTHLGKIGKAKRS